MYISLVLSLAPLPLSPRPPHIYQVLNIKIPVKDPTETRAFSPGWGITMNPSRRSEVDINMSVPGKTIKFII